MAPRHSTSGSMLAERPVTGLGVIKPPPILVQTPTFEGSLVTLLRCVSEHKVDLLDVPLFPICEAYFEYMISAELPDLDEAAAALTALAYLLERKAWMLLPVIEPEPEYEEPTEEIEPTVHEFSAVIDTLQVWHDERERMFFRSPDAGPDPYELPYVLTTVSVGDLARALERVLHRAQPEPMPLLAKPKRSLADQMKAVLLAITHDWKTLSELVPDPFTREEAVYWFLSLLELMRLGQVQARLSEEDVEFARA